MRRDGRSNNEIRAFSLQTGIIGSAAGSALLTNGNTIVLASVHYPQLNPSKTTIDVDVFNPSDDIQNYVDFSLKLLLTSLAAKIVQSQMLPYSHIQISVQILSIDGSLTSTCANSISAALLDACVPMRKCSFVSIAQLASDGSYILDPTCAEEINATSLQIFSSIDNQLELFSADGKFSAHSSSSAAATAAIDGCNMLLKRLHEIIANRITQISSLSLISP